MIDGKPRIGDEVYIHGYIDEIRNDVVIIRNEGGYFGTSDREIFYYEEDERGYGTMNEADRKTENSSEIPNNCEDEPQNDAKRCITCKYNPWVSKACREYKGGICDNYEPQADCDGCQHYADKHTADACYECKRSYTDGYEPQTERSE